MKPSRIIITDKFSPKMLDMRDTSTSLVFEKKDLFCAIYEMKDAEMPLFVIENEKTVEVLRNGGINASVNNIDYRWVGSEVIYSLSYIWNKEMCSVYRISAPKYVHKVYRRKSDKKLFVHLGAVDSRYIFTGRWKGWNEDIIVLRSESGEYSVIGGRTLDSKYVLEEEIEL